MRHKIFNLRVMVNVGFLAKLELWGNHGYSNEYLEMRPFFVAHGPSFQPQFIMNDEFENLDLYNLMCYVLEINPSSNNGSIERVKPMLQFDHKRKSLRSSFGERSAMTNLKARENNGITAMINLFLVIALSILSTV